jgi:hypothetical protein
VPRVTVVLDDVQFAWLEALSGLHDCGHSAVLREALSYLSARELSRLEREIRTWEIRLAQREQRYPLPEAFGFLGRRWS